MPKGSCDPGPGQFNTIILSKGNGQVTITVRYSWDGVSVYPACDGPIEDVRLQNTGTDSWIVKLPHGRALKNRPVAPGTDVTFSGAQLATVGLLVATDVAGVTMVRA